ncbi:MAG: hypothetical protein KC448_01205 [Yoonia sp.]|nr:hypothetical protein [Yoonia sp.]
MPSVKVATCCYCGTKAALVLSGDVRHELACSTCGAPLSQMKMLRSQPALVTAPTAAPTRPRPQKARKDSDKPKRNRPKKKIKFSVLGRKALHEIWDVIEDIFD